MSIESERDLEALKVVGRIVGLALRAMAEQVRPGISTAELNEVGARVLGEHGARSAPVMVYGFPGAVCISLNEEALHAPPGPRVIQPGDLVKLDVTAEKDGYMADAALTLAVSPVRNEGLRLLRCAERAFQQGLRAARAYHRVWEIGMAVEREVKSDGFSVMPEFCGHGIGRTIHEDPQVPNYADPRARQRLTPGLVITVEPIIAAGQGKGVISEDGWTVKTADGSLAAHYEHTIVITRNEPVVLTVAA